MHAGKDKEYILYWTATLWHTLLYDLGISLISSPAIGRKPSLWYQSLFLNYFHHGSYPRVSSINYLEDLKNKEYIGKRFHNLMKNSYQFEVYQYILDLLLLICIEFIFQLSIYYVFVLNVNQINM